MITYLLIGVIVVLVSLVRNQDFFDDPMFKKYEKICNKHGKLGQIIIKASYGLWAIEFVLLWPVLLIATVIGFILSNTGISNRRKLDEIQQNLENAGNNIIDNLDMSINEITR